MVVLLTTYYSFVGEFGGLDWVGRTVAAGSSLDNFGDTVLHWFGGAQ